MDTNTQSTRGTHCDSLGNPIVFSFFGGAHGYCGESLVDGRVRGCGHIPSYRDVMETDRICVNGVLVAPAQEAVK